MSAALPTGPLIQAIGWSLLHLVWQGALVATLLGVVLQLLPGRSNLRYLISCLALTLIVVLGATTGVLAYRSAMAPSARASVAVRPAERPAPVAPSATATTVAASQADPLRSFVRAANEALPRIVMIWLAGVALFAARLILEWLRARRLLTRNAAPAPEPWPSAVRRLSAALGVRHVVRVLESAAIEVPSVVGLVRPAILLPASTLTGLTPGQLEMVLAHELAHIRRHDFLVNLLQAVVETLLFYHPAVWWVSRQIRLEREHCCDDLAVMACGNRLQYARALLRLEELRADASSLALSAKGGSLLERIRRIAFGSSRHAGPAVRAVGALAVVCAVLAIAAPSFSGMSRSASAQVAKAIPSVLALPVAALDDMGAIIESDDDDEDDADAGYDKDAEEDAEEDAEPDLEETHADDDDTDAQADEDADVHYDGDDAKPTLDELIELKVHGVGAGDVRLMRSLFPGIKLRDIAGMKAVGASPQFVRDMRSAGLTVRTAQDAQGLAAVGVTAAYVREMRSLGLEVKSAQDAQGLAAVGVTASVVRALRTAGLDVSSASKAQGLVAVGVTPDYVEEMREAGVDIRDVDDLQSLRAMGVTSDFVRRLAAAGYRNLSAKDLTRLAAAGVTDSFIREMSRYRSN